MDEKLINKILKRNEFLEKFYSENSGRELQFKERVKELNCMYKIAQLVVTEGDFDSILQQILDIIPAGWQFPELLVANIEIYGRPIRKKVTTATSVCIREAFSLNNEKVGSIDICYRVSSKINMSFPFLQEEQDLLKGISRIIELLLKQNEDSKHKQLIQAQLLHSDRLATIGQLAAGVAHELNEPLSSILGYTQLILGENNISSDDKSDLLNIEEASLHAKEIIQKLMNFSRQGSFTPDFVNLSEVVKDGLYFIHNTCIKKKVDVKTSLTYAPVLVDAVQIKQVITNIMINAIQAMKNGGRIEVEVSKNKAKAIIIIKDSGHGIEAENINKIFMPFYTTKDVGEGTGLGLSVVYGIIKAHGGDITVSSEVNIGTTFQIILPMNEAKAISNV